MPKFEKVVEFFFDFYGIYQATKLHPNSKYENTPVKTYRNIEVNGRCPFFNWKIFLQFISILMLTFVRQYGKVVVFVERVEKVTVFTFLRLFPFLLFQL